MSPEAGGSVVMAFAHVFGEATRPSLFRAAMFLVISGIAIIIYGVTSMMSVWKKSVKFMGLVSNWVRVRKGAGQLFCYVMGFGDRTLALAFCSVIVPDLVVLAKSWLFHNGSIPCSLT